MANSVLVVYEPLDEVVYKKNYWKQYIDFYEKYWDGPSSFQSVWFGNEYDDFRKGLSNHLGLDNDSIEDCFFMKDKDEKYYISPLSTVGNPYVFSSENYIPTEWFMLFKPDDKKLSYTHTGYGAISQDGIYFTTDTSKSMENIRKANEIIDRSIQKSGNEKSHINNTVSQILEGILHIKSWLSGFNISGKVVLNYGDICTYIPNYSLSAENSVKDVWDILSMIEDKKFNDAESKFKIFVMKWQDTFSQTSESSSMPVVQ